MTTRADMLFIVEMSVRYHRRRASFLELTSSFMSLATLVGGAGAFLTLIGGDSTFIAKIATLLLAVIGTVQIVFRIDSTAAQHKQWHKQWLRILQDIRTNEQPEQSRIDAWIKERYAIEAECVTEMRALQIDCFNRTMGALDRQGTPTDLKWYHRLFMQVWTFENSFPNA